MVSRSREGGPQKMLIQSRSDFSRSNKARSTRRNRKREGEAKSGHQNFDLVQNSMEMLLEMVYGFWLTGLFCMRESMPDLIRARNMERPMCAAKINYMPI